MLPYGTSTVLERKNSQQFKMMIRHYHRMQDTFLEEQ